MKVLVIGSGGREHALVWRLRQSRHPAEVYCAPGNPGTALLATNAGIEASNIEALADFAENQQIALTIVGPEQPLVAGITDIFSERGLLVAGPSRAAARLEGSKVFAKDFMQRHHIPTAAYQVFASAEEAQQALQTGRFEFPVVLKADGLAAGKGVIICSDLEEGRHAIDAIMRERRFGAAGDLLVVEEFLRGEEASFMAFTDGTRILPMVPAQDHKAIYDEDRGPNTGGMGAYSIDAILPEPLRRQVLEEIIEPTVHGMREEGAPFQGVLYAGLMLTRSGPKVLEYNVRFGDPEAQVILPRLESDLCEIFQAAARGSLEGVTLQWSQDAVVCVVVASKGYPDSYEKGQEISGLEMAGEIANTIVFQAGTARAGDKIVTGGGRVLGVTARAATLDAAIMQAYEGVNKVHFDGMYYRRDIASKGLTKGRIESSE